MLHRTIPITGMKRMWGSVGSNTNKGGEIVVCLDGKPNEIFHVLIHELAHCTVSEYKHSHNFGKITSNFGTCVLIWVFMNKFPKEPNSVVSTFRINNLSLV